jgi:integrase
VTKRLADGREVTYFYAWKGRPKIEAEYGTPEFVAEFNRHVNAKVAPASGVLLELVQYFETTTEFTELAERTQADYRKMLAVIEKEFGDMPLEALPDPATRGEFKEWRDRRAKKSKRWADYGWVVLARVLSVAKDRGKIRFNPCERGGRLYHGSRRDIIWTLEDEITYLAAAPVYMRMPLLLGLWTGQRQADLLHLKWPQYDGNYIRLRQRKTGVRVTIPVIGVLKEMLDAARDAKPAGTVHILLNTEGNKWTGNGFRTAWRRACTKAGIDGLTFHDLRGSSVNRLALAGCTEAEIATFTGLSVADVRGILEKHYLARDTKLADSAREKLERLKQEQDSQLRAKKLPTADGGSADVPTTPERKNLAG